MNRREDKTMAKHQHRPVGDGKDYGWTRCVTPEECAAHPHRQAAHGNIIRVETCRCGATRKTEINCTAKNYGPWTDVED